MFINGCLDVYIWLVEMFINGWMFQSIINGWLDVYKWLEVYKWLFGCL